MRSLNVFSEKAKRWRKQVKITELPVPESVKEVLLRSGIAELYPPQEEAIQAGVLEGKANFIVSGDDHLLKMGSYKRTRIVSVRQFLKILEKDQAH